jgi:hypothetical protein
MQQLLLVAEPTVARHSTTDAVSRESTQCYSLLGWLRGGLGTESGTYKIEKERVAN